MSVRVGFAGCPLVPMLMVLVMNVRVIMLHRGVGVDMGVMLSNEEPDARYHE